MQNPVTPWTATVQADLVNSVLLYETEMSGYTLQIFNAGDSIWLKTAWPETGSIAFRLAFGMNSDFEDVSVNEEEDEIVLTAPTRLGLYTIRLSFKTDLPQVRYTTSFKASFPFLIPYWPRDIVPLTQDGHIENSAGTIHAKQIGTRSGNLYFSMTKPKNGSVFYFQNLTAMSPYCEATECSVKDAVGGEWPEIGFQFPINEKKPIPAGIEYIISDAFVIFDEEVVEKADQVSIKYLNNLAAIYELIQKPEPVYQDWHAIAENVLSGLHLNKGCWTLTDDNTYLTAYAGDYNTPAEIMVQLAVLLPLHEYRDWSGKTHPLFEDVSNGLIDFYNETIKSIVRWHPSLIDQLDKSEPQKEDMVMDSWYLHHPLLNLSRLALRGDKTARKLFLDSVDYAIKVAHTFDYEWPVFYKMTTLEIIQSETSPGKGGEKDVAGSYAHVMMMAYKLTNENRFFKEAIKAFKSLEELAFDIFYQANNTAFTAGALVELYRETNDQKYLDLSYSCLAGIFKNVQLWECNYGYGKNFPNFFAVFPLNDAPYTAAYEEFEVYTALHHYMEVTEGIDILPSLKILIPEFIKYAVSRMPFYYPTLLPEDMISEEVKTGQIQKDLWVPLEDIHDGWEKSGEVGQEVYGSGLPFGVIPRQYFMLGDSEAMGFINYPAARFRFGKNNVTFHMNGNPNFKALLMLSGLSKTGLSKIKVEIKSKGSYTEVINKENQFEFPGDSMVRITW
jgi:hypothetical protein